MRTLIWRWPVSAMRRDSASVAASLWLDTRGICRTHFAVHFLILHWALAYAHFVFVLAVGCGVVAGHIGYVHQHGVHPTLDFEALPASFIRAYVSQARRYSPFIPEALTAYIVRCYISLRQDDLGDGEGTGHGGRGNGTTYTTARTLLSILRLSQALARLRFDEEVIQEDVDEAIRCAIRVSRFAILDSRFSTVCSTE